MNFRTDLAIESHEINGNSVKGIEVTERISGSLKINRMKVISEEASKALGKPMGNYVTIEGMPLTDSFRDVKEQILTISQEIQNLIPKEGTVLVVGIGNVEITPDALGPKSAEQVLATRHITGEFARSAGLNGLRPVAVISPGVLGQTGIEVGELISSLAEKLSPSAVIAVDALASRSLSRLGRTVQISDTGIAPGSGVGNNRLKLDSKTLGIPVIAIGVPTVVDAFTLAMDIINQDKNESEIYNEVSPRGEKMIVTPREIDLLTERASKLIGMSVNCALQSEFTFDDLASLVS